MGARGPKPKSEKQLNAAASWRANKKVKAKSGQAGAKITAAVKIRPPTWMDSAVKKKFRKLVKSMEATGRRFTAADTDVIAAYCQSFVSWRLAEMQLAILLENDPTAFWYATDKGGLGIHPMVQVAEKARNNMLRAAKEIGLSPLPESQVEAEQAVVTPTQDRFNRLKNA
jgi:P27 family predicted phage terminase small subunit